MDFDHVTVWVMQKYLMPSGDGPASVVRVAKAKLVTFAHEALDVIGAKTKMTMPHGIDELLHLVPGV
jgi:hypothetical protein